MTDLLLAILAHPAVRLVVALLVVMAFVGANGMGLVYLERKVAGFIQRRPGPYEVGPQGLLQPVADGLKLATKQLVCPQGADRLLFWLGPLLAMAPTAVCFLPIPFGPVLTGLELDAGLVLILAFAGLNVLALCLAGWGSNNKFALLGAARAVSQSVAYEIPLLLAALAVVLQEGSLNLSTLAAWPEWGVVLYLERLPPPVAFWSSSSPRLAETHRAPFDLPEAESELHRRLPHRVLGMGFGLSSWPSTPT